MPHSFPEEIHRSNLKVARLRFTFEAKGRVILPPFLGSTLRGAFGTALKRTACRFSLDFCERQCRHPECRYGKIFEPRRETVKGRIADLPPAYVIRTVPAGGPQPFEPGDCLSFEVRLFGPGIHDADTVAKAFRAGCRDGLGVSRTPFLLKQVEAFSGRNGWRAVEAGEAVTEIVSEEAPTLAEMVKERLTSFEGFAGLKVWFVTPLRVRNNGEVRAELSFASLVRSAAQRVDELSAAYGVATGLVADLDAAPLGEIEEIRRDLFFLDWSRYSNRQEGKVKLGGMMGEIVFAGAAVRDALPLLLAGEALHIGGATSFGLGRYVVTPEKMGRKG